MGHLGDRRPVSGASSGGVGKSVVPAGGEFRGGRVPIARVRGEKVRFGSGSDSAGAEVRVNKSTTDEVSPVRGGVGSVWGRWG